MLTSTIADPHRSFYPIGNTPAFSLTRSLPQGVPADILLLGCGDVRNILFTTYSEQGFPPRRLDFTCCDSEGGIIARNVVLLSFLVDGVPESDRDALWNIYYHLYLDGHSLAVLKTQVEKLLVVATTMDDWRRSKYGSLLRFCDQATFDDFRALLVKYDIGTASPDRPGYRAAFTKHIKQAVESREKMISSNLLIATIRSSAPLVVPIPDEVGKAFDRFWETGVVDADAPAVKHPNPMFAASMSEHTVLHYLTDTVLGFHLVTAYAALAELSPLHPRPDRDTGDLKSVQAAKIQFEAWSHAFEQAVADGNALVRFVCAEALVFSQTLQSCLSTGRMTANWHRRQFDMRILTLDEVEYSPRCPAPRLFDIVDTSNIADHLGALVILMCAAPLLKNTPSATVYTEVLSSKEESAKKTFENLLSGHAATMNLLLGVSPVEYWTNATAVANIDEIVVGLDSRGRVPGTEPLHTRLAWKRANWFSGRGEDFPPLDVSPLDLASLLYAIYEEMILFENVEKLNGRATTEEKMRLAAKTAYPLYHHGTFAALLRYIQLRVRTEWLDMVPRLLAKISQNKSMGLGWINLQEFLAYNTIWNVAPRASFVNETKRGPHGGVVGPWKSVPDVVALTLVVPRSNVDRLVADITDAPPPRVFQISMESGERMWLSVFAGMQMAFGQVTPRGNRRSDDFSITVEEDEEGWLGQAPLVVTVYVPTAGLQLEPLTARIVLHIQGITMHDVSLQATNSRMYVYEATLRDEAHVFITKHMPNQAGYPRVCDAVKPPGDGQEPADGNPRSIIPKVDAEAGQIAAVIGHVDIRSEQAKELLTEKAPIELKQPSPFIIDIVFGKNELVIPIHFPIPIEKEGAKTRIARKSSYIEVIAPFADPATASSISDFVFPTILAPPGPPVTLNTPHVNLDTLPILDITDKPRLKWLSTLTSLAFSARERRIRNETQQSTDTGIAESPRVNFKESLFTIFMLASGLQGGQSGLFALREPAGGRGIHMLVFASALRLDAASASVALDAAVLPLTHEMLRDPDVEAFLLLLRSLDMVSVTVDPAELRLWKKNLPALAERCRTWSHAPECEYSRPGATIPLSLDAGAPLLCSCGEGRLPPAFTALPDWEVAAARSTRIAISPVFPSPFAEALQFSDGSSVVGSAPDEETPPTGEPQAAGSDTEADRRCRNCGATRERERGGPLRRCTRCRVARYCSPECQRKDWRKHRMECQEVDE
ncbi:MYND finger family protein [Pleurostoma richardsiae]|uniref:MYND finger family protein n=1 Tax=Pleurostoma richardsiae TaxID=41990 RepID=A0AA38RVD4_9PEZI|nr:MYND finger family protein [Pleurostoma richardsiae]